MSGSERLCLQFQSIVIRKGNEEVKLSSVKVDQPGRSQLEVLKLEKRAIAAPERRAIASSAQQQGSLTAPIQQVKPVDISLGRILGSGAFGTVHESQWMGTDVAVKKVSTNNLTSSAEITKEANILARVRHPNIVQIMAFSLDRNFLYIIMEFIQGNDLEKVIFNPNVSEEYNLSLRTTYDIAKQCCQAISYLHGISPMVIHQDIKPSNILLIKSSLQVKVCDMGISKLKDKDSYYRAGAAAGGLMSTVNGTIYYMAPECVQGLASSTTYSDIWSLGGTLAELFSKTRLWTIPVGLAQMKLLMMLNTTPPAVKRIRQEGVAAFLQKCLSYERKERPQAIQLVNYFSKFC